MNCFNGCTYNDSNKCYNAACYSGCGSSCGGNCTNNGCMTNCSSNGCYSYCNGWCFDICKNSSTVESSCGSSSCSATGRHYNETG